MGLTRPVVGAITGGAAGAAVADHITRPAQAQPATTSTERMGLTRPASSSALPVASGQSQLDREASRQSSADAMRRWEQERARAAAPPMAIDQRQVATSPAVQSLQRSGGDFGSYYRTREQASERVRRDDPWAANMSSASRPNYGMWNGLFLWSMLNSAQNNANNAAWWHANRNDPGVQQWRREAEARAADNSDLRARLDALDHRVAEKADGSMLPGTSPDGIDAALAVAPEAVRPSAAQASAPARSNSAPSGGHGGLWLLLVVLVIAGVAAFLFLRSQRRNSTETNMGLGSLLGAVLKRKAANSVIPNTGGGARPTTALPVPLGLVPGSMVEVSMTVQALNEAQGGGMPIFDESQTVKAVSRFAMGNMLVWRAHLADGTSFLQMALPKTADVAKARVGDLGEYRLYVQAAERVPSTPEDIEFLLGENDGLIGWPLFELPGPDGAPLASYARTWSSGPDRVHPVDVTEDWVEGDKNRIRHRMMAYGRRLGATLDGPSEHLIADLEGDISNGVRLALHVGVDVTESDVKTYAAARG